MYLKTLAISLAAGACAVATPGQAADGRSRQVQLVDLDLRSDPGIQRLDSRIHSAVNYVCGGDIAKPLAEQSALQLCRQQTLADVQPARDRAIAYARTRQGTVEVAMLMVKASPAKE